MEELWGKGGGRRGEALKKNSDGVLLYFLLFNYFEMFKSVAAAYWSLMPVSHDAL